MSRWICGVAAALLAIPSTVCFAADSPNPWSGTWKLNEGKSKLTGAVETLSTAPDGKMTVSTSGISFSFGCDGKSYPIMGGRTLVCKEAGSMEMDVAISAPNGDELSQMKRTLSNGGQLQTVEETGKTADGTPFHDTEVFRKVSGGKGWDGEWKETKVQVSTRGVAVVEATADSISFTYPMSKSSLTAKLDGTPATEDGPHAPVGMTVSITADGPLTLHEVDTLNGTVMEHDTLSVSPDGKAMTIEVARTGAKDKQVYVYEKQ